jgi:hypothetical protein
VSSESIQNSVRLVNALATEELMHFEVNGVVLSELFKGSIMARFGIAAIDPRNKNHEAYTRRLTLATLRAWKAAEAYMRAEKPEMLLLSNLTSFLSEVFAIEASRAKVPVFSFIADFSSRSVLVNSVPSAQTAETQGMVHQCPLLLEDVTALRPEVKSWSPDLIRILEELRQFLGVQAPGQRVAYG